MLLTFQGVVLVGDCRHFQSVAQIVKDGLLELLDVVRIVSDVQFQPHNLFSDPLRVAGAKRLPRCPLNREYLFI